MDLNELKNRLDNIWWKYSLKGYLTEKLHEKRFYEDVDGETILDVGCGDCWSSSDKKCNDAFLVGLDISKNALKLAKINKNDNVVLGTAQYLPFKENSFETVLCFGTLFYAGSTYKKVLEELKRVSKGNIMLTFHHKDNAISDFPIEGNVVNMGHEIEYTLFNENDVKDLMKELDLEIDQEKMKTYTLEKLKIHEKNVPQETKATIYVECKKKS